MLRSAAKNRVYNEGVGETATSKLVFSPLEAERMARREWQNPSVLQRMSAQGPEWYIRYRTKRFNPETEKIERPEKWQALGLCSKMTLHQAQREKDRIMRGVNNQVYTIAAQIPFVKFVTKFKENHVEKLAVPSQTTYRQHLKAYIEPAFKDLTLAEVDTIQIERLFRSMEKAGLSRATRGVSKGILKAIFRCARKWRFMDSDNPARTAEIGGGPRIVRQCRVPSLEDVGRLMDACEGDVPLLIETLYMTGMRISEAAGLLVGDLDFERGIASIERRNCRGSVGQTKSDAGTRELGLGDVAVKLLAHVQGKGAAEPVFTWKGEPIVDNTLLANYVSPKMVTLGIKFPGFGWHTFRRLHLSLMAKRGLSIFDLRRQAGHADVRTTQRYIADDLQQRTQAAKNLPKLVIVKRGA